MGSFEDRQWTDAHEVALARARVAPPSRAVIEATPTRLTAPRAPRPSPPPVALPGVEGRLDRLGALAWSIRFCEERGCTLAEAAGRSRLRGFVRVRHALWCILRDTLDLSLPEVALIFGVDHTTVLSGTRLHRARLAAEHAAAIGCAA